VLRVTNGAVEGKIWVHNGDVIDAAAGTFSGEEAFRNILSWKSGSFEIMPAEADRPRTIHNSYQGLLLDTAQAIDEWRGQQADAKQAAATEDAPAPSGSMLSPLTKFEGVEFVLTAPLDPAAACDSWGLDNAKQLAGWARDTHQRLTELGEELGAGEVTQISGFGLQRHWGLARDAQKGLICVGFRRTLPNDKVDPTMKHIFAKWVS